MHTLRFFQSGEFSLDLTFVQELFCETSKTFSNNMNKNVPESLKVDCILILKAMLGQKVEFKRVESISSVEHLTFL